MRKSIFYTFCFPILLITFSQCQIFKPQEENLSYVRKTLKTKPQGCESINQIILGLELDYEFSNLSLKDKILAGQVIYIGQRMNQLSGKLETLHYDKPLYFYSFDTVSCFKKLLGVSARSGEFKFKLESNSVIAISQTPAEEPSEYLDCLIFKHK